MTARTTDPRTSHVAAVNVSGKLPTLKAAFLDALRQIGPATANEIARHATEAGVVANAESVRKRATELVREGLARFGPVKRCSVTGEQARTLELVHGHMAPKESSPKDADERTSNSNLFNEREAGGSSQAVPRQPNNSLPNQERASTVCPHQEERIEAVVTFCRDERGWVEEWRIASDIMRLQRLNAAWPKGTPDEWIDAVSVAVARGLIERGENKRVRYRVVRPEAKVVQQDLF